MTRGRLLGLGAAALVLLIVLALAIVHLVSAGASGPKDTVQKYLRALETGHANTALAATNRTVYPNSALLTDAAFQKARDRISSSRILSVSQSGPHASVAVSYTQAGTTSRTTLQLVRTTAPALGAASWVITNAAPETLSVTVTGRGAANSLSASGTTLPLPKGDGTVLIPVLPGSYTLRLGSSSAYFGGGTVTATARGIGQASRVNAALSLAPTTKLADTAVADVQKDLDACFGTADALTSCGPEQGILNLFDLTAEYSVGFALDTPPELSFDAKTMQVVTTTPGKITATPRDGRWGTFQNSATFTLDYDVTVTDAVHVAPHGDGVDLVQYFE